MNKNDLNQIEYKYGVQGGRSLAAYSSAYNAGGCVTNIMGGSEWKYAYSDKSYFLTAAVDPLKNRTGFEYDRTGNLVSVTGPDGAKTLYKYDPLGAITEAVDPLGGRISYEYDAAGNTRAITGGRGRC